MMTIALIFVLILLVLAFVFLVMQLKHKRVEKKPVEEVITKPVVDESPEVAQLRAYVVEARAKGYSDAQIKEALLAKGWDASLVEKVFL